MNYNENLCLKRNEKDDKVIGKKEKNADKIR